MIMDTARDYQLAEHLITHLQHDATLAPLVIPTVWDDQDQVDAITRAGLKLPGSIAVTPAGYVPLMDVQGAAPILRMHAVIAVSCLCRASAQGMKEGRSTLSYLAGMCSGVLRVVRRWSPDMERICYDAPTVAGVEDYDLTKTKLISYRGRAIIMYAPVNF